MAHIGITPAMRNGAADGAAEVVPWIRRMARVGYAAKGAVYITIGLLAARVAFGLGGETTDSQGALRRIGESPAGTILLWIVAAGLVGYALWRVISAFTDAEGRGSDAKGLAVRAGDFGRGVLHLALAYQAFRLATHSGGGSGGDRTESMTARVLDFPLGRWLVVAAGLGMVAYALYQLYRATSPDKLRKRLDLHEASPAAAEWIVRLGRFGIAARAVIFAVSGVFLVQAALRYDAQRAAGLEDSLDALRDAAWGPILLGAVAIGLVAYGLYELAEARYRRIRVG